MTTALSLRARILLGATLWTVGLFFITGVLLTQVMFYHPDAPRVFHTMFSYAATLSLLAIIFMALGLTQVRLGLSAINQLRSRLADVHDGRERKVEGTYPSEVQPLVTDLNALLAHREVGVKRALGKAGDLAHGLKTPLAVITREAERARAVGQGEFAASVAEQVDRMRRQIDYHLAHARAAASGATPGARCPVVESAEGLARTLLRLHAGRGLTIAVNVPPDHIVRCQREDLDEILGNLLDNACKWGKARVTLTSSLTGLERATIVITVDDDGPGIEPGKRDIVLQRGVRADETAPGSGFGLAIVRELAELYGGAISLGASPAGGVRARLQLPGA